MKNSSYEWQTEMSQRRSNSWFFETADSDVLVTYLGSGWAYELILFKRTWKVSFGRLTPISTFSLRSDLWRLWTDGEVDHKWGIAFFFFFFFCISWSRDQLSVNTKAVPHWITLRFLGKRPRVLTGLLQSTVGVSSFLSPEPFVSWSSVFETRPFSSPE